MKPLAVRVPGSTSNCGAGFDTLGLALQIYNTIHLSPRADGEVRGERESDARADGMVAEAVTAFAAAVQRPRQGLTFRIEGDAPAEGVKVDAMGNADAMGRPARIGPSLLVGEADEMYLYTTQGTVQQMGWGTESEIADNSGGGSSSTRIVGYFDKDSNRIYTNYDTSCQNNPESPADRNHVCVNKGDKLFVVDSCWGRGDEGAGTVSPIFGGTALNECADSTIPNHNSGNIYTVTKIYSVPVGSNSTTTPTTTVDIIADPDAKHSVDTNIIEVDASFPWRGLEGDPENSNLSPAGASRDTTWSDNTGVVILFHFTPHKDGTTEYVSECSGRGKCDGVDGICKCFSGYTSNDCSVQSILVSTS